VRKVVVLFSGGVDSTTLLYQHWTYGDKVICVFFDYGQKHIKEKAAARLISKKLNVQMIEIDLSNVMPKIAPCALTGFGEIENGEYEKTIKSSVVPNRNMIFLSFAISVAISNGFEFVSYGAHSGDHEIYYDCRKEFIDSISNSALLCHEGGIRIITPFSSISKSEIVRIGLSLGIHYEETWSCYNGGLKHCGACGTCIERLDAFSKNGI
jgi:7-cyano-7-deazaguanine synthase